MQLRSLLQRLSRLDAGATPPAGEGPPADRPALSPPRASAATYRPPISGTPAPPAAEPVAGQAASLALSTAFAPIPLPGWWTAPTDEGRSGAPPHRKTKDGGVAVETRSGAGGQLVTLHVAPPRLGPLTVVLAFLDDVLRVHVVIREAGALEDAQAFLPELRRSLAELWDVADIRVEKAPPSAGPDGGDRDPAAEFVYEERAP